MSDFGEELLPRNSCTGEVQYTPLVDDLADVLSRIVVGWQPGLVWMTGSLDQHPEVQRVMARYRRYKENSGGLPDE